MPPWVYSVRSPGLDLTPQNSPASAVVAYRDARSDDCFAALTGRSDLAARLLRARLHIRRGRYEEGLASLVSSSEVAFPSRRCEGEYHLIRGVLQSRTALPAAAERSFDIAYGFVLGARSPALSAEFHHYDAARSFAAGELAIAERIAREVLEIRARRGDDYLVPLGLSRARALQTLALIAAARGAYGEQLRLLLRALDEAAVVATPDRWIAASLAMNLAFLVRDFDLVAEAERLRALEIDGWPADLALMAYHIVRSLGWSRALRGDHVGALRDFKRSADIAPTPALAIWASADRAFLGNEIGDANFGRAEIARAVEIAERVDWEAIVTDDRFALLHLAKQVASIDPSSARPIFERYRRISTRLEPHLLSGIDRRNDAYEFFAEGLIERHAGAADLARARFADAFAIWDLLGYRWLAATAAVELSELGASERFTAYAAAEAAARPNSWLARRVAAFT